jgi:hypothetical protein
MRPHLSLLILVIALGASSGSIAAGSSGSGGGGGHSSGVGGHGGLGGGGFSNSGRFGSTNLGRGSFSQAIGSHAADHAIAMRTALRTTYKAESDKTHPGNPDHHHGWSIAYPTQLTDAFGSCATLEFDRGENFVVGPYPLCGSALKSRTNPRTGRPAG